MGDKNHFERNGITSTVWNMDCMEGMAKYEDGHFDLAIIDPPYGLNEDGKSNHSRDSLAPSKKYHPKSWDKKPAPRRFFEELKRISKHQVIWGANHFVENIPDPNSPCWVVWDKDNGNNDFADCELAYTSFGSAVRKFKYRWNGMLQQNMKNKETRIHPTQKPVALYKWIIQNYAKEGDLILDTHLGSQSSRIAAYDMGFNFIGFELDEDYFNEGNKRFEDHVSQLKLF